VLGGLLGARLAEFGGLAAEAGLLAPVIQVLNEDEHSECDQLPASVCVNAHIYVCACLSTHCLREIPTTFTSLHNPAAEHVVQRLLCNLHP